MVKINELRKAKHIMFVQCPYCGHFDLHTTKKDYIIRKYNASGNHYFHCLKCKKDFKD